MVTISGEECSLTHFMPMVSFYTPWKYQTPEVSRYFPGVWKETSGMKWLKTDMLTLSIVHFRPHLPNNAKSLRLPQSR